MSYQKLKQGLLALFNPGEVDEELKHQMLVMYSEYRLKPVCDVLAAFNM